MNTTTETHRHRNVPNDGSSEDATNAPALEPKRLPYRGPLVVAGGVLLGLVAGVLLAANVPAVAETSRDAKIPGDEIARGMTDRAGGGADDSYFCNGKAVLCSTSITNRPSDTLAKLSTALITDESNHYRVTVSVRLCESVSCEP